MIENNIIYNMDCIYGLSMIEDESVDMVLTSPPYDNIRNYNGYDFDFERISKELFRVIKKGGVVVWVVNDQTIKGSESGTSFKQALYFKELGFNIHDTMIWAKDTFSFPDPTRYHQSFEYMFVLSKGRPKSINLIQDRKNKWAGTTVHGTSRYTDGTVYRKSNHNKSSVKELGHRFNIWEIPSEKSNKTGHPAVFPEQLAEDHIMSWSNKGDLILDIFMGSGTTAKACIKLGRDFIGFEISQEYVKIANERIKDTKKQLSIFDFGIDL